MNSSTGSDLTQPVKSVPESVSPPMIQGLPSPSASMSVLRGILMLLSTQPLTWAATFLSVVIVPRYLGTEVLGEYAAIIAVATLAGTLLSFGVPDYLARLVSEQPHCADDHAAAAAALLSTIAALGAAGLAVILSVAHFPIQNVTLVWLVLLSMIVQPWSTVLLSLLRGQQRHGQYAWIAASGSVLVSVVGVGTLVVSRDVVAYATATLLATIVATVVSSHVARFRIGWGALNFATWRDLLHGGMPFLGVNLTLRIRGEFDRILLVLLSSAAAVGWYAAALRVTAVTGFIPTAVATPLLPALTRSVNDQVTFRRILRRGVEVVILLTIPLSAVSVSLAPVVPELLGWGPAFAPSVPLMMVLAFLQPLIALDVVLGTALIALGMERRWFRVILVGAALNVGLNSLFIPFAESHWGNGALGAAFVTLATEALMLCGALVLLPAGMLDRTTALSAARVVLVGVCVGLTMAALGAVSLPLAAVSASGVLVMLLLVLGVVRLTDLATIRQLVLHKLFRQPASVPG